VVIKLAHSIDAQLAGMAKEAGYKVPGRGEVPAAPLQARTRKSSRVSQVE
jgi:hypothetical protein